MLCFLSIVAILAYFLYKTVFDPLDFWRKRGVAYEKPVPVFGNFFDVMLRKKHLWEVQNDFYQRFGNFRYIGMFQFTKPVLMIKDLELIKQLSVKDFDHFMDHTGLVINDSDPVMKKNLFVMKGDTWRQMRATLSPAFTSAKIRNMSILMVECAKNFQKNIPLDKGVVEYNMQDFFSKFTNDVIASTCFGLYCDSIINPDNEFFRNAKKFTRFSGLQNLVIFLMTLFPAIIKLLQITVFKKEQVDYFHNLILREINGREKQRPDLIHLLMEAKKGRLVHENPFKDRDAGFATVEESEIGKSESRKTQWSDEDLTAQALLFFFAGFETVASTAAFTAYELAINPEIQGKLYNEIEVLMEETHGEVKYDDVLKLKYLDQVLAETLRKWPQAFQTDRICTKDYIIKSRSSTENDTIITKGTTILFPIMTIHRDPKYYPDANKFDPERFNDQNKNSLTPGSYMPFGIGPRNCIGSRFALIELKILFIYLLWKFDIVPTSKTVIPFKLNPGKLNMSADPMFLGLKPRTVTDL